MNPNQASLLEPVAHARRTDPATSHLAATSVRVSNRSKDAVRMCFVGGGALCDEDLIERFRATFPELDISDQRIRTYRHDLCNEGTLQPAGMTYTRRGRSTQRWSL